MLWVRLKDLMDLLPLDCLSIHDVNACTRAVSLLHRWSAYTCLCYGHLMLLGCTRLSRSKAAEQHVGNSGDSVQKHRAFCVFPTNVQPLSCPKALNLLWRCMVTTARACIRIYLLQHGSHGCKVWRGANALGVFVLDLQLKLLHTQKISQTQENPHN